eukprot:gene3702-6591_t
MDTGKYQLSKEEKKRVKKYLEEKEEKKKQYEEEIKQEKRKFGKELKKQKQLYEKPEKDEKKKLEKYQRKIHNIEPQEQTVYQVKQKRINKHENVLKAKWGSTSKHKAEKRLTETEILRESSTVQGGISIEDDDVFSSTNQIKQEDIVKNVDINSQKKIFDIELSNTGPYKIKYNTSGRHVLLGGRNGHVASVQWRNFKLIHEQNVNEKIRDICWMMDDSMYAVAQNKYTYVYDENGSELHRCADFDKVTMIDYLQQHFLLTGCTKKGRIIYKDISLGKNVANIKVGLDTTCMIQNPYNAVMCLGHLNGSVSMVTPRDENLKPVVSMFCHDSPISNVIVDKTGKYLVTTSVDHSIKVWDIRKTYQPIQDVKFNETVQCMDISQKGVLAIGTKDEVKIWGKVDDLKKESYLNIKLPLKAYATSLQFCPYEDVLGIGHSRGMSSALVPGCGESTFDSKVPNPYSGYKNIADWNVRTLLEKIPFDMINLDPTVIGTTGERRDDFKYDQNVQLDDKLKSKLESLGITQKVERKKITSREELTKHLEEQHEKIKENQIGKEWWTKKGTNALDRFASGKQMRPVNEEEEDETEEEEEEEEEVDQNVQLPEEEIIENDEFSSDSDEEVMKNKKSLYGGDVSDSEEEQEEEEGNRKRNHQQMYDYETESEEEEEIKEIPTYKKIKK